MPYAQNNETSIYYEIIGEGHPIILQHGLTSSLNAWKHYGYTEVLKEKYRLILIDARGHGKSSKPHTPEAYSMKNMTSDVTAVMDDLMIDKATFWGYSMGGRIGLALAKYAPERFNSLIIGGMWHNERDSSEEVEINKRRVSLFKLGRDAVIAYFEKLNGTQLEGFLRDRWMNQDCEALVAFCSYIENIGMNDYLGKVVVPCLLYAGTLDPRHDRVKVCSEIIPNAEFVSLQGLDHDGGFDVSKMAMPYVLRFLEKVL